MATDLNGDPVDEEIIRILSDDPGLTDECTKVLRTGDARQGRHCRTVPLSALSEQRGGY